MKHAFAPSGFDRVKELADGHWSKIIGDLYPSLSRALVSPGRTRCACPIHGSAKGNKADGFRLLPDFHQSGGAVCNTCGVFPTGIDLICFLENSQGQPKCALEILESYFGLSRGAPKTSPRVMPTPIVVQKETEDPRAIARRQALLMRIWTEAKPLVDLADDHQALLYLSETRGIADLGLVKAQVNIRWHPALYYDRSEHKDRPPIHYPGLVSIMHSAEGRAVGLHRTFLHPEEPQKAPVDRSKKILADLNGVLNGAIRLHGRTAFSAHANVCEGIETGLSVAYSTGHPVYAAGYATLVASWTPPEGTRFVTIWCDRDPAPEDPSKLPAGINHALKLKVRLKELGIVCRILQPKFGFADKEDWNDVLLNTGFAAISDAYSGATEFVEVS